MSWVARNNHERVARINMPRQRHLGCRLERPGRPIISDDHRRRNIPTTSIINGIQVEFAQQIPGGSVAEAAAVRGIEVRDLVKTIVVRRGAGDYVFVLVPGDREFSWPKLRTLLGVSRLSMPDAAEAKQATGYERGTITPFGASHPWPVFADSSILGRHISMGGGAHGVGVNLQADDAIAALDATVADLTAPPTHAG